MFRIFGYRLGAIRLTVVLLVIVSILGGCVSKNLDSESANNTNQDSQNNEEIVIKIWSAQDNIWGKENNSPGQQVTKKFNEKYKGKIRVEVSYQPWEGHNAAVQAAFVSHDEPDIFQLPLGSSVADYVNKDLVQPLSNLVSKEWINKFPKGSFVEGVNQFNNEAYSWPITGPEIGTMLYYNKTLMKAAGLTPEAPKTWKQLRELSQIVTEQGKGDIYGITYAGGNPSTFTLSIINGLAAGYSPGWDAGTAFNLIEGRYGLNSEPWVNAVQLLLDMKNEGSFLPTSFTQNVKEADAMFANGKAAFLLDGRWALSNLKKAGIKDDFGIAYLPTPDGSVPKYSGTLAASTSTYVVSKSSKHPEAVGKFIEEAFGSKEFNELVISSGVALTPFDDINKNESLYTASGFKDLVQVINNTWVLGPDLIGRNAALVEVTNKLGGMSQEKLTPSTAEILQMLLNGSANDVKATLQKQSDKLNQNLTEAINKVSSEGEKVSIEDFKFSDWDGKSDYTNEGTVK